MSRYEGFKSVQLRKPTKSKFDLSHEKRLTAKFGTLVPIFVQEAIPGDLFRNKTEILLRLLALLAPIYHQVNVFVHFFFVPNRLLWSEWEIFITGGQFGYGTSDAPPAVIPIPPYLEIEGAAAAGYFELNKLPDYMGIPPIPVADSALWADRTIDVMPFAAYHQIYMDYYRDRNYVDDTDQMTPFDSGLTALNGVMFTNLRSWEHDYFTSALPWTQRGSEVLMPLDGTGTVTYLPTSDYYKADGTQPNLGDTAEFNFGAPGGKLTNAADTYDTRVENIDQVLLTSSDVSINDLRAAVRLQEFYERNALGGSRYTESTQAHFGVKPQDSRLQRAEYLGGGKIPIKISEVVSTAYSDDGAATVPLANLAGHGVSFGDTNSFKYYCHEHGFVMGLMSIMPRTSYQQGLPRMFRRRSFLDYPWPTFAQLGEQEVHDYEIFFDPTSYPIEGAAIPTFGYQSRYSDWKQTQNSNHGDFRESLLFWTLTRTFATQPVLGSVFNSYDVDLEDRIFAVSSEANALCYISNICTVIRSLPYFGTPTL